MVIMIWLISGPAIWAVNSCDIAHEHICHLSNTLPNVVLAEYVIANITLPIGSIWSVIQYWYRYGAVCANRMWGGQAVENYSPNCNGVGSFRCLRCMHYVNRTILLELFYGALLDAAPDQSSQQQPQALVYHCSSSSKDSCYQYTYLYINA